MTEPETQESDDEDWTPDSMDQVRSLMYQHLTSQIVLSPHKARLCVVALLSELAVRSGMEPRAGFDWAYDQIQAGVTVSLAEEDDAITFLFDFETDPTG